MDEPPVACVQYGPDDKVAGIVYGDDSPTTARTDCNYYAGYCVISCYPEPPAGWFGKLMHRLSPPPMKVAVMQYGPEGELDEDWCSHLTRELTRHLGFGAVREMVMDYSRGQPWTVAMELSSGNYGPNIEARIRSSVDWILENYHAEMMGGPGDDLVSDPGD